MDWFGEIKENIPLKAFLNWQREKRQKCQYKIQPVCKNCKFVKEIMMGDTYYLCTMDMESTPGDYGDYVDDYGTCDYYKE